MKKTLFISFISILILPQAALAAWWNPATWFKKPTVAPKTVQTSTTTPPSKLVVVQPPASLMKKKASAAVVKPTVTPPGKTTDQSAEIEKLKKEVEELRKKVTAPTPSSPKPSSPAVSFPVPAQTESQQKDEVSYKDYLIGYFNFPIANYKISRSFTEKKISMVEDAIQSTKKDRSAFTGFRDNDPTNGIVGFNTVWNKLIESYNNDIQYYKRTLSSFNTIVTKIDAGLKLIEEEKLRMLPLSFTKEQVIEETKRIRNYYDPKISSIDAEADATATDFVKYHDHKQDEYEELFAYLKARFGPSAVPDVTVRILTP